MPAPLAPLRPLAPFFCLYVTFGTTLGFLASGAPLILRARGIDLAEVGLLQLINLPVGLTFLWAIVVDRVRLPGLPHRVGWIALMQGLAILLLAILSQGETWPLGLLFGLAVATCTCVATMDVALEALVVETVPDEHRPTVASAKLAAASLGGIVGAGLLLVEYDTLGWQVCVLGLAALNGLCLLPMLRYPEARLRRGTPATQRPAPGFARLRELARYGAVLGFYFAGMFALTGVHNLALLDLGVPLAEVGVVTGTVGPVINLVMAPVSGVLVRRFGTVPLITLAATGLIAAGALMAAAATASSGRLAVAAAVLAAIGGGGLGVPVFGMIYRWAQGPRPATDYAILFGAAFFAAMPLRVAAPWLADTVGWPAYLAGAIPFYAAGFWCLRAAIVGTEAGDRAARAERAGCARGARAVARSREGPLRDIRDPGRARVVPRGPLT